MPVRNEVDILPWAVCHLKSQGVDVHVIDNWSFDGSWEILPSLGLTGFERWPVTGPDALFQCRAMLDYVDTTAARSSADWCMYNDADEIRRSNLLNERLADGFARVNGGYFTAVNFQVYLFPPTDNEYAGDPERHFKFYTLSHCDCRLPQVKAWRNLNQRVGLAEYGSHGLNFPELRISPEKWISKHYPIRSQAHGEAKMYERLERFDPAEKARGWHVQYSGMGAPGYNFLRDPHTLSPWEPKR